MAVRGSAFTEKAEMGEEKKLHKKEGQNKEESQNSKKRESVVVRF